MNFLSIGNEPVVIEFNKGVHIITGENKDNPDRTNAIGKSAIADALYFAIFGTPLRDIKKELIANDITNELCSVELDFSVITDVTENYKIVRTINPNKCFLFQEDCELTRDSIANTTADICKIINASSSIFQNCVILSLNSTLPLLAQNKIEKRKFIEGIFSLEVFTRMLLKAREQYNDIKKLYDLNISNIENSKTVLQKYEQQKGSVLRTRKEKYNTYLERQKSNNEELELLKVKINSYEKIDVVKMSKTIIDLNQGIEKCEKSMDDLNITISSYSVLINDLRSHHDEIGTDKDVCSICLKPVDTHDKTKFKEKKEEILEEIKRVENKSRSDKAQLEDIKSRKKQIVEWRSKIVEKINNYNLMEKEKEGITSRIKQLEAWCKELQGDILESANEKTEFDDLIISTNQQIEGIRSQIEEQKSKMAILDSVKFITSEEGVKSFIVKKIIKLVNNKLAEYLSKLDCRFICKFNEFLEEELSNERGKAREYFNFSGAERKAIDLACLFGFSDIRRMQGDVIYNTTIYDELFDSSLDSKGVSMVMDIIKEKVEKNKECVLIISHRPESIKSATGDIIFLEKKAGITKKVNYDA